MPGIVDTKFFQNRTVLRSCEFAAAGLITLLIVLLHIRFCWSAGPLWRDEVCSFHVATIPTLKTGWDLLALENQPVVHYLVLRGWCALGFGTTDIGLRVLGLVIGFLLLSALWLSCWLFNKSPPLWPLAVFGLNQYTLRADSLRPHGLGLVWIVLAFAFIWQLTFQAHPKRRTILLAAIAAVLSVQTVFLNAVLLGAVCAASVVVLAVKRSWRRGVLVFGIGLTAAISLLPYVPLIRQAQQWNGIRSTANTPQLIAQWFVQIFTMENPIADVVFVFLVLSVLALAIIPALRKRAANTEEGVGGHFLFGATACLAGAVGTFGFLWMLKFPLQDRYYLPPMAVIALSVTVATAPLRKWTAVRLATLVGSAILVVAFFRDSAGYVRTRLTNCDLAAEAVAERSGPDDVIVLTRFAYGITFQRYYRGAVPWHGIPDISDYSLFRWDLVKQAMTQTDPIHELLVRMEFALRAGHSVFVVGHLRSVPVVQPLPPAPRSAYGWHMESYLANWREQVSYLIDQHGRTAQRVPLLEKERIDPIESVNVYVISGWR